ncbi:alpha-L-fucosidase [Nonomuraea sediminis]|uniref:alpha-L-fucosidase n=1 Tax=Nonomuraea sediminis TaxID=2835864 RepID=UPI001BDCB378|nr:alpha-L-fucosidase [Nonomuraea sediminis]
MRRITGPAVTGALALILTASPSTASASGNTPADRYTGDYASLEKHPTPQWFDDAKFGIFIHWGAYSVPAWGPRRSYAEWYGNYMNSKNSATYNHHRATYGEDKNYDSFMDDWKAENYRPAEWVKLFKDAGAKYFVLTSKHHEGVALWDTKQSTRSVVHHGPKKDLARMLFDAAEGSGLKRGFYYSNYEWYNPNYTGRQPTNPYTGAQIPYTGVTTGEDYVSDYMLPQMNELIDDYDPDILWCDGEWERDASYWKMGDTIAHFYNQAADRPEPKEVAVANRCRVKPGGYRGDQLDFETPEYEKVPNIRVNKWESSRGIGFSYGLNKNEPVEDYMSSAEIVHDLVDIVSKNGNLLLDVGPDADGTIPEAQASRLRDVGRWLKTNGEAIYGSTYWTRAEEPASAVPVRYSVNKGDLYATALAWPGSTLTLGGDVPVSANTKITLVGGASQAALKWSRNSAGNIVVTMPEGGSAVDPLGSAYSFRIHTPNAPIVVRGLLDLPARISAGATVDATLSYTNVGETALTGLTVTGVTPEGWSMTGARPVASLQPRETATLPVQVTVPAGVPLGRVPVTVTASVSGRTVIASDTVEVAPVNLALGKPVTQSSLSWGGVPERAVDGNTSGVFGQGSVTHTAEPSNQAWWQVDLGTARDLAEMRIYNRTDCCADRLRNYWVMTSEQEIRGQTLDEAKSSPGVTAIRQAATAGTPSAIDLGGVKGRYLRIQLESATDPLSLAEVEVYDQKSAAAAVPGVVPQLSSWTAGSGTFTLPENAGVSYPANQKSLSTTGVTMPGLADRTLAQVAETTAADFTTVTGRPAEARTGARESDHGIRLRLVEENELGPEGYRLTIDDRVTIEANTTAGLYYGSRSVLQLLRQDEGRARLPKGQAVDVPSKPQRWFAIDAARKYWSPDYIKDTIREMGWTKQNMLLLHLEEPEGFRLHSDNLPGLTSEKFAYTREQIQEFVELGRENNVQVVPGFEFPGHADPVSNYFKVGMGHGPNPDGSGATADNSCGQDYTYGWVTPSFAMNIMRPEAVTAAKRILDEFMPWFSSPYVHLGGDEMPTNLANCPAVKKFLADNSERYSTFGDLFNDYVNKVNDHVVAKGKRSIIYNGFEHSSAPKQKVSTDVIVMDWLGNADDPELAPYDLIQAGPSSNLYVTANAVHRLYGNPAWAHTSWRLKASPELLGGVVHVWNDYQMWAPDAYSDQYSAPLRDAAGNTMWHNAAPATTYAEFVELKREIGKAPGWKGFEARRPTTDGKPIHTYSFEPAAYPEGWHDGAPGMNVRPVLDGTGSLHMSTQIIGLPSYVDGRSGKALKFKGQGDGLGIGGLDISGPWTYTQWVRKDGTQNDANLLGSRQGNIKLEQYGTGGKVGFTQVGVKDYAFDYAVPLGRWTQLAFVSDGTATTLYVDGERRQTLPQTIPLPQAYFGQLNGTTLNGAVDDAAVYAQALTEEQVRAQYAASTS